jgi:hypothetical protein
VLAALGREVDAAGAARQACAAQPDWNEPVVFLAYRLLEAQKLDEANTVLAGATGRRIERARRLLQFIREGAISAAEATEYLRLRTQPPLPDVMSGLERMARTWPRFHRAREHLAWLLVKLGRYEEAGVIFRGLLNDDLAPIDRANVTLGLGCIADAENRAQKGEVRMKAAVGASTLTPPNGAPVLPPINLTPARPANTPRSSSAVFAGELQVFALPDLLEFLRSGRRTGTLMCSSTLGLGALRMRDGFITGGASPATPDIGRLLVKEGKLSEAALRSVVVRKQAEQLDPLLGALLVRQGLVDTETVRRALRRQIHMALAELVRWNGGQFAFDPDATVEVPSEIDVTVDPQAALLDIFRAMDEESSGRGKTSDWDF